MDEQTFFDALGDPVRRRLLALLLDTDERCVCELHGALNEPQPKVSRHLAVLRDAGLVASRRQGVWMHYRVHPEVPAWALRIVTRRCQRFARHALREREGMAAATAEADGSVANDTAARDVDVARVLAAMRDLPPAQHAALALFHLEHMGVAEIAVALDIPPGTVKTRLMHARRNVRASLEGDHDGQDR